MPCAGGHTGPDSPPEFFMTPKTDPSPMRTDWQTWLGVALSLALGFFMLEGAAALSTLLGWPVWHGFFIPLMALAVGTPVIMLLLAEGMTSRTGPAEWSLLSWAFFAIAAVWLGSALYGLYLALSALF